MSKKHVGAAKPVCRVFIRRGRFRRDYQPWSGEDFGRIFSESKGQRWQAFWEGLKNSAGFDEVGAANFESWREITHIAECSIEQGFDENGLNRMTLVVDNRVLASQAAVSPMTGVFHTISRGYYSPWRGYAPPGEPAAQAKTSWYSVLNRNSQIVVWQGYGSDTMTCVFTGLVDDIDMADNPDKLTITARDFGQVLVDERIFGWNKTPRVPDPVIFADRWSADEIKLVGGTTPHDASSTEDGYLVKFVADGDSNTNWRSAAQTQPANTEWVQIRVPQGRYESIQVECGAANMELYVGVHGKAFLKGDGTTGGTVIEQSSRDGVEFEGWCDIAEGALGLVPGDDDGGWPYVRKIGASEAAKRTYRLNGVFYLGEGSIIRLGFRKLAAFSKGPSGKVGYRAVCKTFQGVKRNRKAEAIKKRWVLTDDASDVVRIILRWAGFKEWMVEDVGARLKDRLIVNRATTYMDVIRQVADQSGYVFFMADPYESQTLEQFLLDGDSLPTSKESKSLGIPTFRESAALRKTNARRFSDQKIKPRVAIRDTDLLTGISARYTDEPLTYIIRVRGQKLTKERGGKVLDGDKTTRITYVYRPPWTRNNRMGGVLKHTVHYDPNLKTSIECEAACLLIAFAQSLKSATAVAQIPANPEIELDDQVYLLDTATGLSTRLWVAQRSWTWSSGENAAYTMSVSGALIDTPDIVEMKAEMNAAVAAGKLPSGQRVIPQTGQ